MLLLKEEIRDGLRDENQARGVPRLSPTAGPVAHGKGRISVVNMTVGGKFTNPSSSWRSQQRVVFMVVVITLSLPDCANNNLSSRRRQACPGRFRFGGRDPCGSLLDCGVHRNDNVEVPPAEWRRRGSCARMTSSRFLRRN